MDEELFSDIVAFVNAHETTGRAKLEELSVREYPFNLFTDSYDDAPTSFSEWAEVQLDEYGFQFPSDVKVDFEGISRREAYKLVDCTFKFK